MVFAAVMVVSMFGPAVGATMVTDAGVEDVGTLDGSAVEDAAQVDADVTDTQRVTVDEALRDADGETQVVVRLTPADVDEADSKEAAVRSLQGHAEDTQSDLVQWADRTDHVTVDKKLWIANAVLLTVDTDEVSIKDVAARDNVDRLHANFELTTTQADSGGSDAETSDSEGETTSSDEYDTTYGLEMINATEVWDQHNTQGAGAAVAVLDTGMDDSHPDLPELDDEHWQEWDGDGNPIDTEPSDGSGHGTHVSGTVAGAENPDGDVSTFGVAPDAELYHGAVIPGGTGSFVQVAAGMEWAVDDTDADIISMSLGGTGYGVDMIEPSENARDAGVILVGSAGNDGEGTTGSPGNVYPNFASGAVDENADVASFSSGETVDTESAWGSDAPDYWPDEYVVPNAAAPGVNVLSSVPGGGYDDTYSGTSMSAPHKAGAFALMVAASGGDADREMLIDAMEDTAWKPDDADEPAGVPDERYGNGIIDVAAATNQVALDSGVTGTVTDSDGEPVEGAAVEIEETGFTTETDADGGYELLAEPGTYTVTSGGFGYAETTESVEVPDNETFVEQDFELADALGVELVDGQPSGVEGGDAVDVTVNLANADEVTVDLTGDYAAEDATLFVAGEQAEFGDAVDLGGLNGEATISVETTADTTGELGLEHAFAGAGDSVTVATGPTTVFEEYVSVAVVDDDGGYGEEVADRLDGQLSAMYDVSVVSSEEATDGYDVAVVQNLAEDDPNGFIGATNDSDTGVVYLDQWGSSSNAIPVHSDVTGEPESTSQDDFVDTPITYELQEDHELFDGVGGAGDTVDVHSSTFGDHTWFEGTEFETLADVGSVGGAIGPAVAVDDESATVFASSLGHSTFVGPDEYTDDADAILGNSVEYVASDDGDDPAEADFRITDVDPGEDVTVSPEADLSIDATVENQGDETATQAVEFVLAGDVVTGEEVSLGPGESTTVTFDATAPSDAGTYDWYVTTDDDQSETWSLIVEEDAEEPDATLSFAQDQYVVVAGETFEADLTASADGVAGYETTIEFDPDVVQVESTEGVDLADPVTEIDNENGSVSLAQAQANDVATPTLATIEFELVGDAGDDTSLAVADSSELFSATGEIDIATEDSDVMVGQLGDVNADGEVTVWDAVLVQQHIAGQEPADAFYPEFADVTQDGAIHVGDVNAILAMALDGDASGDWSADAQNADADAPSVDATATTEAAA